MATLVLFEPEMKFRSSNSFSNMELLMAHSRTSRSQKNPPENWSFLPREVCFRTFKRFRDIVRLKPRIIRQSAMDFQLQSLSNHLGRVYIIKTHIITRNINNDSFFCANNLTKKNFKLYQFFPQQICYL